MRRTLVPIRVHAALAGPISRALTLRMLIPFRTDRPRLRPPYLTIALIAVNTLVQLYSMAAEPVAMKVRVGTQVLTAYEPRLVVEYGLWGNHPTLLTLLTHMFIHG